MEETKETWVQTLGQEDPLEKGMATHSSILAWRIPVDTPAACSFPGENARSWGALGEARPGQSSQGQVTLGTTFRRYRAAQVSGWIAGKGLILR